MTQEFTGNTRLYFDCPHESGCTLLIGINCFIGEREFEVNALLDTGAEWSILEASVAAQLGYDSNIEGMPLTISTRLGRMEGQVVPILVTFPAENGEDLTFDAKWFICEYWNGPTVLGWRGLLNLIRFSSNPDEDRLYFAAAEGRAA